MLAWIVVLGTAGCVMQPSPPPEGPPTQPVVEAPAEPKPKPEPPAPGPRVSDAERLLAYYEYLLTLEPDALAQEQERTLRFYGEHRSEFALMQLVLIRCRPNAPKADRIQALEMLSSYLKENAERPADLRPLALMLRNQLLELQRQDAEIQAQVQKLKEEKGRSDQLKEKLDALVETERKMLERTKPTRNP